MTTAAGQIVSTAQQIAGAEHANADIQLEIPESPEVFYGGMDEDCMQLPFTPAARAHLEHPQAAACQQQNTAEAAYFSKDERWQSNNKQQRPSASSSHHISTDDDARAEHPPAARSASPVSSAAVTGASSLDNCSSGLSEGVSGTGDDSDADWSPEQPHHQQQQKYKQKQVRGSGRKGVQQIPVKTPNRQPFPEIQHDLQQLKHLTSPTVNRKITECFAAVASATPMRQPQLDGSANLAGAAGAETTAAAVAAQSALRTASGELKQPATAGGPKLSSAAVYTGSKHMGALNGGQGSQTTAGIDTDSDVVIMSPHVADESESDSDVQCVGETTPQQELQQRQCREPKQQQQLPTAAQQQQQQQQPLSSGLFSQQVSGICKPLARNLSISRIRENAALAKAAKLAARMTAETKVGGATVEHMHMQAAQTAVSALTPAASAPEGSLQRKRTAAAAGLLEISPPTGAAACPCAADPTSGSPAHAAHIYTPAKLSGKTPVSLEQQQSLRSSLVHSIQQHQRHMDKCIAQVVDDVLNQHPDPSVRAAGSVSSRKRQRRASWEDHQRAFTAAGNAAAVETAVAAAAAECGGQRRSAAMPGAAGMAGQPTTAATGTHALHDNVACDAIGAPATAVKCLAASSTAAAAAAAAAVAACIGAEAAASSAAVPDAANLAAAAADQANSSVLGSSAGQAVCGAQHPMRKQERKRVTKRQLKHLTGTAPAPAHISKCPASGITATAAAADPAATAPAVDNLLVLKHAKLLDSEHLKSWPAVGGRSKAILPEFTFTPAAREFLNNLVKCHPQTPMQLRLSPQSVGRSRKSKQLAGRGRVTAGSSPATGASGAAAAYDGEVPIPFPALLDYEKGVYKSWEEVPRRKIVFMEFMSDGLVFHTFKPQYEEVFHSAERRQKLASNILVAQGDGCHPCNFNPLEPVLDQQQWLQIIQEYYQAQQLQCDSSAGQQQQQQRQQHSLGRLLLAAHDLDEWQLLGMYMPGQSGFMLTSEDDERTNTDLTFEAAVYPYQMTFDFHQPQDFMGDGAQVAVMTEADPNHCMMALINDSTEWTHEMDQLGKVCPSRAGLVADTCMCHKYKGRSDNAITVQSLYKADDGTPVPVALFFTSRRVLAQEELLWSYGGNDSSKQPSDYFATQRINRAQRTCLQLENVMRQLCCQWLQEDQQHLLAFTLETALAAPGTPALPTAACTLHFVQQRRKTLEARLAVWEYVSSHVASLRSRYIVQQLLGSTLNCDAQNGATLSGPSVCSFSSSQQQQAGKRHRTRQRVQELEQQQALARHLVEKRAFETDPVSAVDAALATGQLAGRPLPAHWRCMLVRLQKQLQSEQVQREALKQDMQDFDEVVHRLQQQVSPRKDAGLPCLLPTEANTIDQLQSQSQESQGQKQHCEAEEQL